MTRNMKSQACSLRQKRNLFPAPNNSSLIHPPCPGWQCTRATWEKENVCMCVWTQERKKREDYNEFEHSCHGKWNYCFSSANIKLEANSFKKSVITMKSAEVNASLWPSQCLSIAVNILWLWMELIRSKPRMYRYAPRTQSEYMLVHIRHQR